MKTKPSSIMGFAKPTFQHRHWVYLVGALGTIIEWYDFILYGCFAFIFSRLFFVSKSHWLSLFLVYTLFFISYLVRPLGGLLYGYIGDYFGRKAALILSISTMTLGMFATAMLPTWQVAGVIAPVLLIIFRIVQGFSAGGETAGSLIYVLESVESKRHGLYGGSIWAMIQVGEALAALVAVLLMHFLTQTQLFAWGWRLAYLIGGFLGVIIFFLRVFIPESLEFSQAKQKVARSGEGITRSPLKEAMTNYKLIMFTIVVLSALPATVVYFVSVYFSQYIHQYFSIPLSTAWQINTVMLCIMVVVMVIFGALSDRIGRPKMLVVSACCFLLFSYFILNLVSVGQGHTAFIMLLLIVIILSMYMAPLPAVIVKLAPLQVRYTVFALGYNIAFAIFGGSSPLICSQLARWSPLAPAFYFMILALLSLSALWLLWRNKNNECPPTILDKGVS